MQPDLLSCASAALYVPSTTLSSTTLSAAHMPSPQEMGDIRQQLSLLLDQNAIGVQRQVSDLIGWM